MPLAAKLMWMKIGTRTTYIWTTTDTADAYLLCFIYSIHSLLMFDFGVSVGSFEVISHQEDVVDPLECLRESRPK